MSGAASGTPPRVLVVRLSALGDVVTTLPAFDLLRRSLPGASFAWAVEAPFRPLVEGLPAFVIPLRTKEWRRKPFAGATRRALFETRDAIRDFRADLAIDFQGTLKSAVVTRTSGAPLRIGLGERDLREPLARRFYTARAEPAPPVRHVVLRGLALAAAALRAIGVEPAASSGDPLDPFRHVPADPDGRVAAFVAADPRPLALLQPAAGWANKEWGSARFGALARTLGARGFRVAVLHGPGEEPIALEVVTASAGAAELAPKTSIRELAALLSAARLAIGGDTGPIHLAAGLGTPTLGLLGPTVPAIHGPRGPRAESAGIELSCRPCARRYDEAKPCLVGLSSEAVEAAIARLG